MLLYNNIVYFGIQELCERQSVHAFDVLNEFLPAHQMSCELNM